MVSLVALTVCLWTLIVHYHAHLRWRLVWACSGWNRVGAIPMHCMPDTPIEENWPRCRFGPLEFILPPEFVNRGEIETNDNGAIFLAFRDEFRSMMIVLPTTAEDRERLFAELREDYALPSEGQRLSLTRLRPASYRASADDFRWSMTEQEVRWHAWCISMRRVFTLGSRESTEYEYLLHDDVEGILNLRPGAKNASFDWQTADDCFVGSIMFAQKSGQIDPAWIRRVCQSVKFSASRMPKPIPQEKDKLRALLEIAE